MSTPTSKEMYLNDITDEFISKPQLRLQFDAELVLSLANKVYQLDELVGNEYTLESAKCLIGTSLFQLKLILVPSNSSNSTIFTPGPSYPFS